MRLRDPSRAVTPSAQAGEAQTLLRQQRRMADVREKMAFD
jgi:hypothetical protein